MSCTYPDRVGMRSAILLGMSLFTTAVGAAQLGAATLAMTTVAITTTAPKFGDYYKPFAASSLWNARPMAPVLGTYVIPKSTYFPSVAAGTYSTGVFLAKTTDAPMTVYPISGTAGVMDQDSEIFRPSITLPRWPGDTLPAAGSDGHADIVDPVTGTIHSFFKLKKENGRWVALLYAWMPLAGNGWSDPAHYYQGARAVGIPAAAGLIRRHEVDDGKATYEHALAMSLTYNGLSPSPAYVFPATSADSTASQNTGKIPEGALLMLPKTYNTTAIASPALRKIAETLKLYGAYVVDRNTGTPFVIYVEIGSTFKLSNLAWDNAVATELDRIRANLRQVVGASSWVDGNGVTMTAPTISSTGTLASATTTAAPAALTAPGTANLLSLRGPWKVSSGPLAGIGIFDSANQMLAFPKSTLSVVQSNSSGHNVSKVVWAATKPGDVLRLKNTATGGAMLRMTVYSGNTAVVDTGYLGNGQTAQFTWPTGGWSILSAKNGLLGTTSTIKAELKKVPR